MTIITIIIKMTKSAVDLNLANENPAFKRELDELKDKFHNCNNKN